MSSEAGSPRCLDCGAELSSRFCRECGQEDSELRVSLRAVFRDFASEQLGLESKVPATFKALLARPGFLTKEYLAGRRTRWVRPLRLYLTTSVIYFLVLSFALQAGMKTGLRITDADSAAIDSSGVEASAEPTDAIEEAVLSRSQRIGAMSAEDRRQYFGNAFTRYMPNAVFVLLPVFTLILYLLYRKTGRYFAEHLIFTLHIHAFAFLALLITLPLPEILGVIAPLWLLIYLYLAMKRVYGESTRRTAGKFAALLFSYMLIFQVAMLGVIGLIFFRG